MSTVADEALVDLFSRLGFHASATPAPSSRNDECAVFFRRFKRTPPGCASDP
jgi:hypothetical protein